MRFCRRGADSAPPDQNWVKNYIVREIAKFFESVPLDSFFGVFGRKIFQVNP